MQTGEACDVPKLEVHVMPGHAHGDLRQNRRRAGRICAQRPRKAERLGNTMTKLLREPTH